MKLVLIRWHDAVSHASGWKDKDQVRAQKPPLVQSVGWVLARAKDHITIAASIVDSDCDGDVTIPLGMIHSIDDLTVKKGRGK